MPRLILFFILLVSVAAGTNADAKRIWHPKPIFTEALCKQELSQAAAALGEKLKEAGVEAPSPDSRDAAVIGAYTQFLKGVDRETKKWAAAQARAAGKWKGPTRYKTLKWQGRKYRITSCQVAKIKIPMTRALRVVKVTTPPTAVDKQIAEEIQQLIKVKNARRACRQIRPFKKARRCLAQYADGWWLDRYPM
jgi:hypothetical protein